MFNMTKKILAVISIIFISAAAFAQRVSYSELLKKAQDFESQGKYIHALGAYYDAMEINPSASAQAAYEGFSFLSERISAANFNDSSMNEFDVYDVWIDIIKDYEEYWSQNVPFDFKLSDLEKISLNFKNRTATYATTLTVSKSAKYSAILSCVQKGFTANYRSDWEGIPSDWISGGVSYYNQDADSCLYNGIPLLTVNGKRRLASTFMTGDLTLYDLQFKIVDNTGKELFSSVRKLAGSTGTIDFPNVDQDTMRIIDSGNVKLVLEGVYLKYGDSVTSISASTRNWSTNLYDFIVDTTKVCIESSYTSTMSFNALRLVKSAIRGVNGLGDLNEEYNGIEFNFVEVEEGTFMMGSTNGDSDEMPVHEVFISELLMGETEVTQGLYKAVMGTDPSSNSQSAGKHPVENVSWFDAIVFCNKLSELMGLTPCYAVNGRTDVNTWNYTPHYENSIYGTITCDFDADGYRLPTEAEWEYAARGGINHDDYIYAGSNNLDEVAWNENNSAVGYYECTHEVATLKPNSLGIYDMSGNVREWVWDFWDSTYYSQRVRDNPTGPSSGSDRVRRGGSYDGTSCRVCYRVYNDAYVTYDYCGFRICKSVR